MPKDFSDQNLRGRSFKGQDLAGANFSYADIRSCDFSGANLKGANFTGVKAGLQRRWLVGLIVASWLLAGVSGFFLLWIGALLNVNETINTLIGIGCLLVVVILLIVSFYQGLENIFGIIAFIITVIVAGVGAVIITLVGAFAVALSKEIKTVLIITIVGTLSFAIIGARLGAMIFGTGRIIDLTIAFFLSAAFVMFGAYIEWYTCKRYQRYTWIHSTAIAFAAIGGTSFRNADLTEVDFSKSNLKGTDFTNAILTHAHFYQVRMLDHVRPGKTYLQDATVSKLLIFETEPDKNFDRKNLRGVNLQKANLTNASFIGADLSHANLQDADLTRAKLVQTQLDGTDFTGATLTGAYIEDWNITTDTKFDGVRCEYVYMRLPTQDNPDPHRKPDNRQEVFADGEFGDFIKPIFDTLDLYHSQGVDPKAIAISFKQLAENHPDAELEIVAMEKRGEDKFLLRAKTAITADKSELSAEYFDTYNQLKALAEREVKALIAEKDSRIADLQNMVVTALQRPSFYAQTYQNQGDTIMPEGSKRESNFNLQGAQFGGGLVNAETVTAHQIGGNITNYTAQDLRQTEPNKSAVKTILILASNPETTSPLKLDREVREIDSGLQRAKKRELFDLKQRWAVRIQDIYQSFLDLKPQFVHFSGHGAGDDRLVLEDETGKVQLVDTQALAGLFELFATSIECVVLNACYSEVQANAIAQHIPYVIGMSQEIGDQAAIKFATGFYNALGAGESVEFAYKLGCSVIQLEGIPEHLTPVLIKKQ